MWGDWFGKPLDNLHIVEGARDDGHGGLVLVFHHREVLRVAQPRDWTVDATAPGRQPRLLIRDAERVEWGWYYYGRPEVPENWFEEHHWREGDVVRASTTATWYVPSFAPTVEEPAVIFL